MLRAYAFIEKDYLKYTKPLSTFLDRAMESLEKKNEQQRHALLDGIIESITFQKELFGRHMFSRSILSERIKIKLNSALFEVWISEIFKLSNEQKSVLLKNKELLVADYKVLLNDETFVRAVSTSTSGKGSVVIRFESINLLIKKFIK